MTHFYTNSVHYNDVLKRQNKNCCVGQFDAATMTIGMMTISMATLHSCSFGPTWWQWRWQLLVAIQILHPPFGWVGVQSHESDSAFLDGALSTLKVADHCTVAVLVGLLDDNDNDNDNYQWPHKLCILPWGGRRHIKVAQLFIDAHSRSGRTLQCWTAIFTSP